jgi:putative phosphoribosyl transferase
VFEDRTDAGRRLAEELGHLRGTDTVVLGLPRGGVPVAFEVARALDLPLDVIVVRKLGVPQQPELGMGALGEEGVRVLSPQVVRMSSVSPHELQAVEARERAELERRAERFRAGRPRVPLTGRTALVVDDGIATGSTAAAACLVARARGARRVVLACPVAAPDSVTALRQHADEVICLQTPRPFHAVGQWYRFFDQTRDDEVVSLLQRAAEREPAGYPSLRTAPGLPSRDDGIVVPVGAVRLSGHLVVPAGAPGVVVFAHGSGSSRHSPRNRFVADVLSRAGLGTLLVDLLAPEEETDRRNVFDISLLAFRLLQITAWLRQEPEGADAQLGYFGASTGAAAALWAASDRAADIGAVVSRGGSPDLAADRLALVRSPTLLIVGGRDTQVLELNRAAQAQLRCESRLDVVPGATHLFQEPGALESAAGLARDWFLDHLVPVRG